MTPLATLLSILASLWTLITGFRRKDAATQVAERDQKTAKQGAEIARQTTQDLNQKIAHVDQETADMAARVRAADSLRDSAATLDSAVDAARRDVSRGRPG